MTTDKKKSAGKRSAMSVASFCKKYDWGRTKTYELIREGKLVSYLIGRRRFICASSARRLKKEAIKQGEL